MCGNGCLAEFRLYFISKSSSGNPFFAFLDFFFFFWSIFHMLKFVWIFSLHVSVDIFLFFCLPCIDHRYTNAKNVSVSLEFSVCGNDYLSLDCTYFISESSSGNPFFTFFGRFFFNFFCQYFLWWS